MKNLHTQDVLSTNFRFVINSLDEYDRDSIGKSQLATLMLYLTRSTGVKILLSSRPEVPIEHTFRGVPGICLESLTSPDILAFIHSRLWEDLGIRGMSQIEGEEARNLSAMIISSSQGMFLWVALALEITIDFINNHDITAVQRNGELLETISDTWTNNSEAARNFYKGYLQSDPNAWIPLYYVQPTGQDRVFRVGHAPQVQMTAWLDRQLVGTASRQPPDAGQFFTTDLIQGIDQAFDQDESGLEALVSNMADAMTAALHTSSGESAPGVVLFGEPYIYIDWVWIMFPLMLYILAVSFVTAVALQGRSDAARCHVWKNSIVAALCHGLEGELSGKLAGLYTEKEIDEAAKDIKVKLATSGVRLQLVSVEPQELVQWQVETDGVGR